MRKKIIAVSTALLIMVGGTASWAAQVKEQPLQLELGQAVEMSIKSSQSLRKSSMNIDKTKEQRDYSADSVYYRPNSPSPIAEAAWYSLMSADLNWRMSKRSYTAEEDRLVLDTCKKYWNVQKSIENVRDKEMDVRITEQTAQRIKLMVELGMTPPEYASLSPNGALTAAQSSVTAAKSALEEAKNTLQSDYEALNLNLGLNAGERPQLTDEIEYEVLPEVNLDYAAQVVIDNSPTIWQAEEMVNLANYSAEMMWASGQYTPYQVRKIEQTQAKIDASTAKDATRQATRNLYYTIRNIEAGMPALEKALETAEESFRVAKIQYELGMITKENLVKAEAAVEDAKLRIFEMTQQHAYLKLAFEKPWAVTTT